MARPLSSGLIEILFEDQIEAQPTTMVFSTLLDSLRTRLNLIYFLIKKSRFGDVFPPSNPHNARKYPLGNVALI